jgi:hypothetical protein
MTDRLKRRDQCPGGEQAIEAGCDFLVRLAARHGDIKRPRDSLESCSSAVPVESAPADDLDAQARSTPVAGGKQKPFPPRACIWVPCGPEISKVDDETARASHQFGGLKAE